VANKKNGQDATEGQKQPAQVEDGADGSEMDQNNDEQEAQVANKKNGKDAADGQKQDEAGGNDAAAQVEEQPADNENRGAGGAEDGEMGEAEIELALQKEQKRWGDMEAAAKEKAVKDNRDALAAQVAGTGNYAEGGLCDFGAEANETRKQEAMKRIAKLIAEEDAVREAEGGHRDN
jgi:hypothetical protein